MDMSKKAIVTSMVALVTRPKLIGVAAAVAILLMLILAPSTANFNEEIRFTGTVTDKNPADQVGGVWWNVTVEEIISGVQPPCDILRVEFYIIPPGPIEPGIAQTESSIAQIESGIDIGDRVEVYGRYTTKCKVSLNDDGSYYIKKIAPEASTLSPIGLIALVCLLSAIAAVTIVRKRR